MVTRIAVACLLLGLGAVMLYGHFSTPTKTHQAHYCATSSTAFLSASDLGAFDRIVDSDFASLDIGPRIGAGTPGAGAPDYERQYLAGRLVGYIADVAVTGPDRADEDRIAKSFHYSTGKWPLVPLTGKVVQDNAGLLEFYQTNWQFESPTAAVHYVDANERSAKMSAASIANGGGPQSQFAAAPAYGDEEQSTLGPADGTHEYVVSVTLAAGSHAIELVFRGGSASQLGAYDTFVREALNHLQLACAK